MNKSKISAIILTFNSANSIERTLRGAFQVSDDIHIVDSYSTDDTVEICKRLGCKVVQHPFNNYADQRNWAIDNLALSNSWQLHLDADEEMTAELIDGINNINLETTGVDGWMFGRRVVFLGAVLRFGAISLTWHYRLFRSGAGRCESRFYDQHFVPKGTVGKINAFMLDHQEMTISEWTIRHNRWADLEAREVSNRALTDEDNIVKARFQGNDIERKRYMKSQYYKMPLFMRAFSYFLYGYFLRLGFLDGTPGLIYHFLQGCWFRFLVDAKIYEKRSVKHV
jgi:glycosyltransferase involved in cell wall biosynthesis